MFGINGSIITMIMPIFIVMAVGALTRYFPGKLKLIFTTDIQKFFDRLVYNISLPIGTFLVISKLSLHDIKIKGVIGVIIVNAILMFFIGVVARATLLKRFGRDIGAIVAVAALSNNALYIGIPLIDIMVDHNKTLFGLGVMYSALSIPVMITAILLMLAFFGRIKVGPKKAFASLLFDPVLWSIVFGLLASVINFSLPAPIVKTLEIMASISTPIILLVIGSRLSFSINKNLLVPMLTSIVICSFVSPLLAYTLASHIFELSQETTYLLMLIFGMPIALASSSFLTNAGVEDQELNTANIVISTIMILVTMPLWRIIAFS